MRPSLLKGKALATAPIDRPASLLGEVRLRARTLVLQLFANSRPLYQPAMTPKRLAHNIRISVVMPKDSRQNSGHGESC